MTNRFQNAVILLLKSSLVLVIGVSLSTMTSILPESSAVTSTPQPYLLKDDPVPHLRAPPAPDELGCHSYTPQTGWVKTDCMTDEEVAQLAHPQEGGGASGVNGVSTTSGDKNNGETFISFNTYHGETDSLNGVNNSWSLQLNTNTFTGNNGHTDWVQYTYQNKPGGGVPSSICVWAIDLDTQDYTHVSCANGNVQTLSSTYSAYILGVITNTGRLQTTFCYYPGPVCTSVNRADTYGLNGHWSKDSGTILGYGDYSGAQFTSTTSVLVTVYLQPATSATGFKDTTTGEWNNLNAGTRSTSCFTNYCYSNWYATN